MPNSCCHSLLFIWLLYTSTNFQNKCVFETLLPLFDTAEIYSWVENHWRKGRIRHRFSHTYIMLKKPLLMQDFDPSGRQELWKYGANSHFESSPAMLSSTCYIWSSEITEGIWSFLTWWCYAAEIEVSACRWWACRRSLPAYPQQHCRASCSMMPLHLASN